MADSQEGTIGPINWGSNAVNGQLVPQAPTSAFYPRLYGAQYTGPKWPGQAPYSVPPVIPNSAALANTGQMGQPTVSTQMSQPNSSPWHPTKGTIVTVFVALVLGLFMLQYIHYGSPK